MALAIPANPPCLHMEGMYLTVIQICNTEAVLLVYIRPPHITSPAYPSQSGLADAPCFSLNVLTL